MARGMEFAWRRVPGAAGGAAEPPPPAEPALQAETTALVARMTVAPSSARTALIDAAIAGLKADGVWAKLDWLVMLAAHDAQAARLNWRAAKALVAVNSPVFTVDRGYAGDGTSAYLDFGERFDAVGNLYALNSATIGLWVNQQNGGGGTRTQMSALDGSSYAAINAGAGSLDQFYVNDGNGANGATSASRTGHRAASRTGAAVLTGYVAGAVVASATTAATAVPPFNGGLLRYSVYHCPDRVACSYSGAGLSTAEIGALHGRLDAYLGAIGAT